MNTDTQTLTDTEPMPVELVPVIIVEVGFAPHAGPCYCRTIEEVGRALEEILGDDESLWAKEWVNDCESFIHIRTGLRHPSFFENMEAWEL